MEATDERTTERPDKTRQDLVLRLNRIEGQVRGVRKMIEEEVYCDDVLNQIASIQAALGATARIVLEHHLKTCVVRRIQAGEPEVVEELLQSMKTVWK